MFFQKLVGGNNGQIFPWLLIEECVALPLGGPPLNGLVFERLHLLAGTLPACQPVILRAPESNHGGHGGFDVLFKGYLDILFGFECRIEQQVSNYSRIVLFGIIGIIQTGVCCCQQSNVPACRASACDNAFWIYAQFGRVLFVPPNCTLSIRDAESFTLTQPVVCGGGHEPTTREVVAEIAE